MIVKVAGPSNLRKCCEKAAAKMPTYMHSRVFQLSDGKQLANPRAKVQAIVDNERRKQERYGHFNPPMGKCKRRNNKYKCCCPTYFCSFLCLHVTICIATRLCSQPKKWTRIIYTSTFFDRQTHRQSLRRYVYVLMELQIISFCQCAIFVLIMHGIDVCL